MLNTFRYAVYFIIGQHIQRSLTSVIMTLNARTIYPPPANSTQTKNSLRSRNPSEILSNVYDSDNLNTSNANVVKHLYERWLI